MKVCLRKTGITSFQSVILRVVENQLKPCHADGCQYFFNGITACGLKNYLHFSLGRYGYGEYIFRYGKNGFRLIGYEFSENRGPVISYKTSINFLTGKKLISENINKHSEGEDEVFKETWHKIKFENIINLSEIKDFDKLDLAVF